MAGLPLHFLQALTSSYCGAESLCWLLSISIKLFSVEAARNSFLPPSHFSSAHTSKDGKPAGASTTTTKTNRAVFLIKAWIVEAQHQHFESMLLPQSSSA